MAAGRVRKMTNGKQHEEFIPDVGWERWRGGVDEKLGSIASAQGELKAGLTEMTHTITQAVREAHEPVQRVQADHEKRIRDLETHNFITKAKVALFSGVAGIVGGGLSSALWALFFKKIFP